MDYVGCCLTAFHVVLKFLQQFYWGMIDLHTYNIPNAFYTKRVQWYTDHYNPILEQFHHPQMFSSAHFQPITNTGSPHLPFVSRAVPFLEISYGGNRGRGTLVVSFYVLVSNVWEIWVSPQPLSALDCQSFFIIAMLVGARRYLMILICVASTTNNVDQVFTRVLEICI